MFGSYGPSQPADRSQNGSSSCCEGPLSVHGARQEAFELLANDLVKKSLLRFMARGLGHEVPDRDRLRESADEEARADQSAWHWGDAASV